MKIPMLLTSLLLTQMIFSQETTKVIDEKAVEKIKVNQTSEQSLIRAFGQPARITGTNEERTFSYGARNGQLFVRLNKKTVIDYSYSSTGRSLSKPLQYGDAR